MAAKKRRSKKKKNNPERLKQVAWSLLAVTIVAVASLRYFETAGGSVFLLKIGFDGRTQRVREELDARITEALRSLVIPAGDIRITGAKDPESGRAISSVRVEAPERVSLIQANAAIDSRVRELGASVLSCEERAGGRAIEMKIGVRRLISRRSVVTHDCYISISRRGAPGTSDRRTGPVIAIVVDDFGYFNNSLVRDFLSLEVDLSISVLPGLKHSRKICEMAVKAGKEVICHLPMEPEKGADDVGDIPLVRVSMTGDEIQKAVEKALEDTPGVTGMNNHMGSKATTDRRVMDAVIGVCRKRKLFFFDSLTTSRSVVGEAALKAGVATARNDLFLDNREDDTRENMRKLLSMAVRRGRVAAVMHVRKDSLKELRWLIVQARKEGVRIVRLSEIMEGGALASKEGGRS